MSHTQKDPLNKLTIDEMIEWANQWYLGTSNDRAMMDAIRNQLTGCQAALQASANLPSARDIRNAALEEAMDIHRSLAMNSKDNPYAKGFTDACLQGFELVRALKEGSQ